VNKPLATSAGRAAAPSRAAAADELDAVCTWKLSCSPGDGGQKATLTVTNERAGPNATCVDSLRGL
jgi:hypothetical protein